MHRVVRTQEKGKETSKRKEFSGTNLDRAPASQDVAVFAAQVKSLTNYEVWKRVEAMMLTLTPGQEPADSADWWRFQILLDELQWRLSGLEGAGSATGRIRLAA
jgi:hypothetical protein